MDRGKKNCAMTIVTNRKSLQNGLHTKSSTVVTSQKNVSSSVTSSSSPSLLPVLLYLLPAWEYTVGVLQILQGMYCPMLCCTWTVWQCLMTIITNLNTKQDHSNGVLMKLALPNTSQINQEYHWLWALASNSSLTLVMESSCLTWSSPCRK